MTLASETLRLSLLVEWLGSGKNFEAFKFGLRARRKRRWLRSVKNG
jgi:hypothetical protein